MALKQGRVIRIFDDANLVINLGSADGIEEGATAHIFAPPVDIHDPETGEALGSYNHPKDRVRIETVFERFCVAGPFPVRRQTRAPAVIANPFQQFQGEYTSEPGSLDIDVDEADPLPTGSAISVGDPVYISMPETEKEEGTE